MNEILHSEEEEIYRENILEHYKNPHNYGTLDSCSFTFSQNNPVCGDHIDIFVTLEQGKVKEVIQVILLEYYDKLYRHTVDSKTYSFEVHSLSELQEKTKNLLVKEYPV